jgi:TolB-like protein
MTKSFAAGLFKGGMMSRSQFINRSTFLGLLLAACGLLLVAGCATVAPYHFTNFTIDQDALAGMRQKRVAVLSFGDQSGDWQTSGNAMADEFSLQLGKTGRFDIVERTRVTDLFREQDFDPQRLDPTSAAHIGDMLGAHGVIMGTITHYRPGKVGLSIKLVVVETGRIAWQASDVLSGHDERVQALVSDQEDRERLITSPEYLGQMLCRLMAETLK